MSLTPKTLQKIKEFSKIETAEMYAFIDRAANNVSHKEHKLREQAKSMRLAISCYTNSNINLEFRTLTGVPADVARLHLVRFHDRQRTFVWYAVRDVLFDYYAITAATHSKDTVKFSRRLKYHEDHFKLTYIKQYKNCNTVYQADDNILKLIHDYNTIGLNMAPKQAKNIK